MGQEGLAVGDKCDASEMKEKSWKKKKKKIGHRGNWRKELKGKREEKG